MDSRETCIDRLKIVIADDEPLARLSLVSMIEEMNLSFDIAGEVTNGEEMLELVRLHHPDVAIVDIRMPKMDGIEAIRRGAAVSPQTGWIILSGFSEFRYAQQAIRLGVGEYLLKPVDPDELEKAIRTVCFRNKEHAYLLNCEFENRLFTLCHGLAKAGDESAESPFGTGMFQALLYFFDSPAQSRQLEAIKREFNASVRRAMPEHLVHGAHLALFTLTGSECVVAGAWDPGIARARQSIRSFFHQAEKIADGFRHDSLAVTAVLTEACDRFDPFLGQIRQVREREGFRAVFGLNRAWRYRDVMQRTEAGPHLELGRHFLNIADHYRNGLYLDFRHALESMAGWFDRHTGCLTEDVRQNVADYVRFVFGTALSGNDWKAWIGQLKELGEQLLLKNGEQASPADLVDQVIRYVENHYMHNIGLNLIAEELNVTPSYLSTLFHRKTGITFVKYVTRLRMLKAKELLTGTNLQIREVAERVGYYSTRHFTKLFVEQVGMYPSDFRKSRASSGQHPPSARADQIPREPEGENDDTE